MRFLVVYGTTDGHTARVAKRIGDDIRALGHEAVVCDAGDAANEPLLAFDAILVGASLHARGYQLRVKRFVRRNVHALRARPTALFSVCLAIESRDPASRAEARRIPRHFAASFGWLPDATEVVAGALAFSKYGFLRRFAMKQIAAKEMGSPVDTERDHVFTDWGRLADFTREFVGLVESRAARALLVRVPAAEATDSPSL